MRLDQLSEQLSRLASARKWWIGEPGKAGMLANHGVDNVWARITHLFWTHGEDIPAAHLRLGQLLSSPVQAIRARFNLNRAYFPGDRDKPQPVYERRQCD